MPVLLPLPALSVMLLEAAWVGPTMAVSLVVIALSFLAIATGVLMAGREAGKAIHKLSQEISQIRQELEPTMRGLREAAEEGRGLAKKLQLEVDSIIQTSQGLRHDLRRGVKRAKHRLSDLDALAEVMQGELEDTALDVAAKMRTLRSGFGVIGRLRRFLPRRRR
jgi:hypothetical protein